MSKLKNYLIVKLWLWGSGGDEPRRRDDPKERHSGWDHDLLLCTCCKF